jgi:hypothetical protein
MLRGSHVHVRRRDVRPAGGHVRPVAGHRRCDVGRLAAARALPWASSTMSALLHETLVDFLRLNPVRTLELMARLLAPAIPRALPFERARLRSAFGLEGAEPDVAIELDWGVAHAGLLLIVEVQLRRDESACLRWQATFAHTMSIVQRPTMFVILAPDPDVAAWARREVTHRTEGWFRAHVLGPDRLIPSLRRNGPAESELAILRGLVLGDMPALAGALVALYDLPPELRRQCLLCMADRFLDEAACPAGNA